MLGKFSITNKLVARNLDIPVERVNKVMGFFVTELEEEMASIDHTFLYVKDLGTFGTNIRAIEKSIKALFNRLKGMRATNLHHKQERIDGLRREIYKLLLVRRAIKKQSRENKELRCLLKSGQS